MSFLLVWDFLTFFHEHAWGSDPLTNLHAKWLKWRGFTNTCAFWSKSRQKLNPLTHSPPKMSKFGKFLDLENFRSISRLTLGVSRVNTPYSSSEPNKSVIVNKQCGGEKFKYVPKFYIGGTGHVISQWTGTMELNISKTLGNRIWFQYNTNRKPHMGNRIVTWSMTSRDLERSRS